MLILRLVVELWNGSGIVRVLGKADVLQLVYVEPATEEDRSDNMDVERAPLVSRSQDTGSLEIYDLTQAINRGILCSAVPDKVDGSVEELMALFR